MKKLTKILSILILSSFLVSCNNTKVISEDILDPVDIVLNEKEKVLTLGEKYQIEAQYVTENSNLSNVNFAYQSLNTSVATVSNSGLVEAVGIGETIIQITYEQAKALFKIIVQNSQESSLLGLNIYDSYINLYEDDQFTFRYEARLNGESINLTATYYDYDNSVISIENNVITALNAGNTNAKIKVTYGDLEAIESFAVSVMEPTYYLSCNYENNQVIVGEEDLQVSYSLNYGSHLIKNLSLNEMTCHISNDEIATINGGGITGLKKGLFDLEVSYYVSEINNNVTSSDSFRCREKYVVKLIDLDKPLYVLDGDKIEYIPINDNDNLVFDAWLKDGVEFDEPVESDLKLGIRWKINEFNFAQDVKGAKSIAPYEGDTGEIILAVSYSDDDIFNNGLKYDLSKNCHGDYPTEDSIANIYLPKIDYKKATKVTYHWKTNGYVTIDQDHWYGGALPLGGTIDITYDGNNLTQTITQTYDITDPFNGTNYKNITRTLICSDNNVINGNENLKSITYWAYTSITTTSSIYLSNPKVSVSHEYLPYIRLGNYSGALFSTSDPNAHYEFDSKKPTIIPTLSENNNSKEDYLYYYQDRQYDESQGWGHCRANYTLVLPAIDFSKQDEAIVVPFEVEIGFYIGFAEDKVATEGKGQMEFEYVEGSGLLTTLNCNSTSGFVQFNYICTDENVINGSSGFTFPVCYSMFCFQRGAMFYQPRFKEKCTHNYIETTNTDRIGYFGTVCCICGESGELSENLMHLNDIDFTTNTYGAQGGKWGTYVQPTIKTMTYEVTAGKQEEIINLPKINFSLYKTITFSVSGNDWDARVGLETGSYAFPYAYRATPYTGTLRFTVEENQVNVLLSCEEGTNQNLVITDADIINGDKSFSLFMYADNIYRSITIELKTLSDSCSHDYVVSTEKIGAEVCSLCGEERDYAHALDDIDFTVYQYGAQGGRWTTYVQPTAKTMMFEVTAGNTENVINLPKINYKAFSSVRFTVTCGSYAIGAGIISGSYVMPGSASDSDPAHTGVFTLAMNGNQLEASLRCNETSDVQNIVITDADVINGNVSLNLYMYSVNYAYQTITIELTALN